MMRGTYFEISSNYGGRVTVVDRVKTIKEAGRKLKYLNSIYPYMLHSWQEVGELVHYINAGGTNNVRKLKIHEEPIIMKLIDNIINDGIKIDEENYTLNLESPSIAFSLHKPSHLQYDIYANRWCLKVNLNFDNSIILNSNIIHSSEFDVDYIIFSWVYS